MKTALCAYLRFIFGVRTLTTAWTSEKPRTVAVFEPKLDAFSLHGKNNSEQNWFWFLIWITVVSYSIQLCSFPCIAVIEKYRGSRTIVYLICILLTKNREFVKLLIRNGNWNSRHWLTLSLLLIDRASVPTLPWLSGPGRWSEISGLRCLQDFRLW